MCSRLSIASTIIKPEENFSQGKGKRGDTGRRRPRSMPSPSSLVEIISGDTRARIMRVEIKLEIII